MLDQLSQVLEYLNTFKVEGDNLFGRYGVIRVEKVLKELGNPQNQYKIVHVCGTSGKTSISMTTSKLLVGQGLTVGLTYSPHISSLLERFQVNSQNIEEQVFLKYFNQVKPVLDKNKTSLIGKLTYFEVSMVLALYIFAKVGVQVAVIETGVGGLYDASNIILEQPKICLISTIGLDHQELLGQTVQEIAYQKAGIIQAYNTIISIDQPKKISKIISTVAKENKANLKFIQKPKKASYFSYKTEFINLQNLKLAAQGSFQYANIALALEGTNAVLNLLNKSWNHKKAQEVLETFVIPGRLEILNYHSLLVVLDGAHNQQKMSALVQSLNKLFKSKKINLLVAFKSGKDYQSMLFSLKKLEPQKMWITDFIISQDFKIDSVKAQEVLEKSTSLDFQNIETVNYDKSSLDKIISQIPEGEILVITGSLYLISLVRKYFV